MRSSSAAAVVAAVEVRWLRFERRVGEQRAHEVPLRAVVGLGREPGAPRRLLGRPVDAVEPVPGVVGVAVERLRSQQVGAGVPERRALGQRRRRQRDRVHPHTIEHRRGLRELVLHDVEQRLVVVRVDVGDRLRGITCVPRRLAVVVDLGARDGVAVAIDELVVTQVAGETDLDLVVVQEQSRQLLLGRPVDGRTVGRREQARGEALDPRVGVEGAAAAHRVAQAVGERADARPRQLDLAGLREAGPVGHFTEVPSLSVHVDAPAVDAVTLQRQLVERVAHCQHVGQRVVAHQVEPEAVDLVLASPRDDGVDHQLLHHLVLARRVGTARRCLDCTSGRQPLVVARHDPVEHALGSLAGLRRVVVDDVHHHAQTRAVEGGHHLPELERAARSLRVGGVRALRCRVVPRVVAPVEAVGRRPRRSRTSCCSSDAGPNDSRSHAGVAWSARRSGMVAMSNTGSRWTVLSPAVGKALQLLHPDAAGVRERQVAATVGRRHGLVADREVAHVQLVDRRVLGLGQRRLGQAAPAGGPQRRIGEVDDDGARRVGRERQRVRVGDGVRHDLVLGRHVDVDVEQVAGPLPVGRAGHGPHAVGSRGASRPACRPSRQGAARAGRRPWPSAPTAPTSACRPFQVTPSLRSTASVVDVVEHTGDLHAGGVDEPSEVVIGGDGELSGEQLGRRCARRGVTAAARRTWRGAATARATLGREPARIERQGERRAAEDRLLVDDEPAGRAGVQAEVPPARLGREVPGDQLALEPVRLLRLDVGQRPARRGHRQDVRGERRS